MSFFRSVHSAWPKSPGILPALDLAAELRVLFLRSKKGRRIFSNQDGLVIPEHGGNTVVYPQDSAVLDLEDPKRGCGKDGCQLVVLGFGIPLGFFPQDGLFDQRDNISKRGAEITGCRNSHLACHRHISECDPAIGFSGKKDNRCAITAGPEVFDKFNPVHL